MRWVICALLVLGLGSMKGAAGQNLLVNPSFFLNPSPSSPLDEITGWGKNAGCLGCAVNHSDDDAIGEPGSGSALGAVASAFPGTGVSLVQIVPVTAGIEYTFGSKMKRTVLNGHSVELSLRILWGSDDPGFVIPPEEVLLFPANGAYGTWVDVGPQTTVAPAGATRVTFSFNVVEIDTGNGVTGWVDRAYFGTGTLPVGLEKFDVE
jgi:hypothetical protein